jgi:hypothetical protein
MKLDVQIYCYGTITKTSVWHVCIIDKHVISNEN